MTIAVGVSASPKREGVVHQFSIDGRRYTYNVSLEYSPYQRRCSRTEVYKLENDTYLSVPKCQIPDRKTDDRVIFYHADRDTWELGPKFDSADVVFKSIRESDHQFKIFLRTSFQQPGVRGFFYNLLGKPLVLENRNGTSKFYGCKLDTRTNAYSDCTEVAQSDINQFSSDQASPTAKVKEDPKVKIDADHTLPSSPKNQDPMLLQKLAGVYKNSFETEVIVADGPKNRLVKLEDIVEIVPVGEMDLYFRIDLNFYNAHSCHIYGIAHREEEGFVYRQSSYDQNCALLITTQNNNLLVDDNETCNQYCGARGSLSKYTTPMTRKRPIRYLDRLRKSDEYRDAILEWKSKDDPDEKKY
jgi:hypothetical protein